MSAVTYQEDASIGRAKKRLRAELKKDVARLLRAGEFDGVFTLLEHHASEGRQDVVRMIGRLVFAHAGSKGNIELRERLLDCGTIVYDTKLMHDLTRIAILNRSEEFVGRLFWILDIKTWENLKRVYGEENPRDCCEASVVEFLTGLLN